MELEKLVKKRGIIRAMVTKACDAGTKFLTDNITQDSDNDQRQVRIFGRLIGQP